MTYLNPSPLRYATLGLMVALLGAQGVSGAEVSGSKVPTVAASSPASKADTAKDIRLDGPAVSATQVDRNTTWPSEQLQFSQAISDIALSVLREQSGELNAVVSAFSLANALGLVQLGAKGKTSRELAGLFQPTSAGTGLLIKRMGEINATLSKPLDGATLTSANRLWVSQSLAKTLDPTYAVKANKQFQSDAQLVAFEVPAAAGSINEWVRLKTKGHIPQLLQAAQLKANTHLVVTNAVHFKGRWAIPFDVARTALAPFTLSNATQVDVPTMRSTLRANLANHDGAQLIELPYINDDFAMQIVLPAPGQTLPSLQASLSGVQWSAWAASLKPTQLDLSMPRLKIGGKAMTLKPSLQKLGVETVFTQAADLSGLSPANGLMLDDVYQSATVQVDEEGAQASAATAAVATAKSLSFPTRVELNRPFLFAIIHKPTQTQLFVGRVMNPAL